MKLRKSARLVAGAVMTLATGATAYADAGAQGATYGSTAKDSESTLSGNVVQVPVHVPVNACGNSINVVGLFNPVAGNTCVND
ncbi:chaplin [Streptomyces longispororuber]|uniref:chaplin n=1 Tax=Streptomyces longispororuber TaxID=68230 RepID=UPI00340A5FF9